MKILIKSDVYNICNRVKDFDVSYKVVYDTKLNKYQIYSTRLTGVNEMVEGVRLDYICTLPYGELDARAIKYLYDTRVENIEELINKIDINNQRLERDSELKACQQSSIIAENTLRQLTK